MSKVFLWLAISWALSIFAAHNTALLLLWAATFLILIHHMIKQFRHLRRQR
jgi:hypothetical protein